MGGSRVHTRRSVVVFDAPRRHTSFACSAPALYARARCAHIAHAGVPYAVVFSEKRVEDGGGEIQKINVPEKRRRDERKGERKKKKNLVFGRASRIDFPKNDLSNTIASLSIKKRIY